MKAIFTIKSFVVICIGVSLLLVGFILGQLVKPEQIRNSFVKEVRLPKQYEYINPLLECDSNIGNYKLLNSTEKAVNDLIDKSVASGAINTAAVYYRDLNNGPWFGINEETRFTPASLIKVPMMILYYKKAETDPTILQTKLKVDLGISRGLQQAYIKPDEELMNGEEYTIDELIDVMIAKSNNTAYLMLKEHLDQKEFNALFNDFGINIEELEKSTDGSILSIREYSSFFRILYNSSYLSRDYSEKALKLLSQSDFSIGIEAGLPREIVVADKFGERHYPNSNEGQLHDCGVVYKPDNPYLVCIMTRGKDFEKLPSVISQISKIIYETTK